MKCKLLLPLKSRDANAAQHLFLNRTMVGQVVKDGPNTHVRWSHSLFAIVRVLTGK